MGFKREYTWSKTYSKWLLEKYVTQYGKQMDDMMVLVIVKKTCVTHDGLTWIAYI
jgi:hypothetical protein